ncbi:MAG: M23 family metallopeptidase [Deltaproteobacteria bacterium]|nr:M23 family metallopeptidase [Candidatus Zymogenaceae bacterium]
MKRLVACSGVLLLLLLSAPTTLFSQDIHDSAKRFYETTSSRVVRNHYNASVVRNFCRLDQETLCNFPFGIPTSGTIMSHYGYRVCPFDCSRIEFHSGIDIANNSGHEIFAAADGVVSRTGWTSGYGVSVVIDHNNSVSTLYAHLSESLVVDGQKIKKGELIGLMGSTGLSTGPHLHYEILINDQRMDPMMFWDMML